MRILLSKPLISHADVHGKTSVTHWACGCHLKCPFCHNWRIAEWQSECIDVTGSQLYKGLRMYAELVGAWEYVDCIHLTGGEPMLTATKSDLEEMRKLADGDGKCLSVNSSLALHPSKIRSLSAAHHVAFDVKVPFGQMTGLESAADRLLDMYKRNVRFVADNVQMTEARVPVSSSTRPEDVAALLDEIDRQYDVIVVFPLINAGADIHPRDPNWPYYKMHISRKEAELWKRTLSRYAGKVVVRNYFDERE